MVSVFGPSDRSEGHTAFQRLWRLPRDRLRILYQLKHIVHKIKMDDPENKGATCRFFHPRRLKLLDGSSP